MCLNYIKNVVSAQGTFRKIYKADISALSTKRVNKL